MVIRSSLKFIRQNSLRRFDQKASSSANAPDNSEEPSLTFSSNGELNTGSSCHSSTSTSSTSPSSSREGPRRAPSLRGSLKFLRSNSLRRFDQQHMQQQSQPSQSEGIISAALREVQEHDDCDDDDSEDEEIKNPHDSFDSNDSFSSFRPTRLNDDSDSDSETSFASDHLSDDDDDDGIDCASLCESDDDDDSETCTTATGSLYSGHQGNDVEYNGNNSITSHDDNAVVMPVDAALHDDKSRRALMKRSNSSKRNVVVASAMKSAKFLRGIVRANSAKTLMSVLKSTEDAPLDVSSGGAKQQEEASSSCCKNSSFTSKRATSGLRKPQRMASTHQERTTAPGPRKPERALSGLVPPPAETPSRPHKSYQAFGSAAPALPQGIVDEEPEPYAAYAASMTRSSQNKRIHKEDNRRVVFATNDDGSVQCDVKSIRRIEEKSACWYSPTERNAFAENFTSVVEYYQDNAEYVESLKRLYNIARLAPQEMERHLQTLANHPHARGLENYIVRKGGVLRRKHTCRVLAAQDVAQWASSSDLHLTDDETESENCEADDDLESDEENLERLAEELRRVSVNSSQRCQRLAFEMATFDTNEAMIAVCSPWQTQRRKWHDVLRSSLGQSSRTLSNSSSNSNNSRMSAGCNDKSSRAPRPARRLARGMSFNAGRKDENSSETLDDATLDTPTPPLLLRKLV